jgi:hypothetical protein
VPTDEQRRFVAAMAGVKLTWDEMASLIINPTTNESISKRTLAKDRLFTRVLAPSELIYWSLA